MFEIHKRHTPMFVTSEVKHIAQLITHALEFDALTLENFGIEMIPIFQTARINENNEFIIKSKLGLDAVMQVIKKDPILKQLRINQADSGPLLENLVNSLVEDFGVDSYLCIGEQKSIPWIEKALGKGTKCSQKPVIIFTSSGDLQCQFDEPKWYDLDHPAIWLQNSVRSNMTETEAFFAISPTLKMEVELNRFQTLESFGSFAIGMVRF